jgi:hypothetical protein
LFRFSLKRKPLFVEIAQVRDPEVRDRADACPCISQRRAQITINGKKKHLGVFVSEREAAKSYDVAARKHFGDFAVCNFPPEFPCAE